MRPGSTSHENPVLRLVLRDGFAWESGADRGPLGLAWRRSFISSSKPPIRKLEVKMAHSRNVHAKTLVVVESPAKARTIKKYLGSGFDVKASVGHVKDLPRTAEKKEKTIRGNDNGLPGESPVLGVDVFNNFTPQYMVIPGKEKIIKELRDAAGKAERILLATDPDREGEAIAWHLSEELGKPQGAVFRVLFNELTEKTIKQAIASPSKLDANKYNAQQARRILDRIVGYQLSPLLWQKVQYGLSAGRVQSVALRLIVARQNEIEAFVPQEYWSITARLDSGTPPQFDAKLVEDRGAKTDIPDIQTAQSLAERANQFPFEVAEVKRRERSRRPIPPFITSTLQQEASRKLKMSGSRAMRIAQQLYEGMELGDLGAVGLITYMRTDSPRIAPEALEAVRTHIKQKYGDKYLPDKAQYYKGRKTAQEAHEAIRPTSMSLEPEKVAAFLDSGQLALYKLIWNRFIACQMAPALFDLTTANIRCGELMFRVTGSVMKFDGFLKVYKQDESGNGTNGGSEETDKQLPPLKKGQTLELKMLSPRQHFTQPPPPYNEASLIKELEEKAIGRPSTYADIVSTIQKRNYVKLEDKRFKPTTLGRIIDRLLLDSFPHLLDTQFTADMESKLDRIEEGSASWIDTLSTFFGPFQEELKQARQDMRNVKREGIPTARICPHCGEKLLLRSGRYGLFLGCSTYPDCDYTRKIGVEKAPGPEPIPTGEQCPTCNAPMVQREGRTGAFLSCSRYPECKTTRPITTGIKCPKCGKGELAQRRSKRGKTFFSCSRYPDCDYVQWNKPVNEPCPNTECGFPIMEEKTNKKSGSFLQCPQCKAKIKPVNEA